MNVDSIDFNVVIVGCGDIDNSNSSSLLWEHLWEMASPFFTNWNVGYYC
jgi:hypothetical protein